MSRPVSYQYLWAKKKLGPKSQTEGKAEIEQHHIKTIPDDVWVIILNILLSEPNVTKDVLNAFLRLEIPEEIDTHNAIKRSQNLKLLELNRVRARLGTEPQEAFTKVYVNGDLAYRIYRIAEVGRYVTVDPEKPTVRDDDRGRGFGDAEGAIISEGHGRARVYSRDNHEIKLLDGNLLRNPYFKVGV